MAAQSHPPQFLWGLWLIYEFAPIPLRPIGGSYKSIGNSAKRIGLKPANVASVIVELFAIMTLFAVLEAEQIALRP
jgi:hypothetical protein